MAQQTPFAARKSSTPWERLRPVRQDPLESMGFVSKGDDRLLDPKAQETFYHKIVARYMQFCTQHSKDLDRAFASLSLTNDREPDRSESIRLAPQSTDASLNNLGPSTAQHSTSSSVTTSLSKPGPIPEDELSNILTALRKLREGLLASSGAAQTTVFSQRVHVFNIRLAILARHPPSYHPSLNYLMTRLHTKDHPLPRSELMEMTTYLILDLALRRNELMAAYTVRHTSKQSFGYANRDVDAILRAVTMNNWVAFWRVRRKVDGYIRAIIHWYTEAMCRTTLKAFGRTYMQVDAKWLLSSATGSEMAWEQLVAREKVGWVREGDLIIIRKPKLK